MMKEEMCSQEKETLSKADFPYQSAMLETMALNSFSIFSPK